MNEISTWLCGELPVDASKSSPGSSPKDSSSFSCTACAMEDSLPHILEGPAYS